MARPVVLQASDGPRYNPSDFSEYFPILSSGGGDSTSEMPRGGPKTGVDASFSIDPDAVPPFDKFDALWANSRKFRQTWDKRRTDFPSGDYSASSYDLALANLLMAAGWSDQEIVDTCIAWRRKHGEDDPKKIHRYDYWRKFVLARAADATVRVREFVQATEAAQRAWEEAERPSADSDGAEEAEPRATVEDARRLSLLALSKAFGVQVDAIYRVMTKKPSYLALINGEEFPLGETSQVLSQTTVQAALFEAGYRPFDRLKAAAWLDVMEHMIKVRVDRHLGVTEVEKVSAWLERYLRDKDPVTSKEKAWEESYPYRENGRLHLFFDPLYDWTSSLPDRPKQEELSGMLKAVGAELRRPRLGGRGSQQRRVWVLPASFMSEDV